MKHQRLTLWLLVATLTLGLSAQPSLAAVLADFGYGKMTVNGKAAKGHTPDFANPYVMVVRRTSSSPPEIDRIDRAQVERIVERSREVMSNFQRLFPGVMQFEPFSAT